MVHKTAKTDSVSGRLMLVSAPWPIFNRPSLPLGALKAYLHETLPAVHVSANHLFLTFAAALGYDQYQAVSRRVWRAESIFSALLYPDRIDQAARLYHRSRKRSDPAPADFNALVACVKTTADRWLDSVDWSALDMVGFSVSFCQVTASLYLMAGIKTRCPSLPVVVGGSSFSRSGATALFDLFPQIDFLVVGEGELPLTALLRRHLNQRGEAADQAMAAVVSRSTAPPRDEIRFSQLTNLDDLPAPDYDDYFKALAGLATPQRFFPTLPIEASRGCWWHRPDPQSDFTGCAFCNLNLQWQGYRTKTPRQVVAEIDRLTGRYQVLSLAFADNAFPLKQAGAVFDGIRSTEKQVSLFTELRADTPTALLPAMRQAGIDTVQIGIEALSSGLLAKMNKGTRAIDNINLMKHCLANDIHNASNLMLHFPASEENDVAQTLAALDFVIPLRPLKTVSFWLGLESPVHRFARRFHIRAVYPHPHLKRLFPAPVAKRLQFMIQGYRGDRGHQLRIWRPVQQQVRQWKALHDRLMRQTGGRPALACRSGRDFLIIDQHRAGLSVERHRLTGDAAAIYRFCDTPRSFDRVADRFPSHGRQALHAFLTTMVKKRLMFTEDDHFLNLAVPVRP